MTSKPRSGNSKFKSSLWPKKETDYLWGFCTLLFWCGAFTDWKKIECSNFIPEKFPISQCVSVFFLLHFFVIDSVFFMSCSGLLVFSIANVPLISTCFKLF